MRVRRLVTAALAGGVTVALGVPLATAQESAEPRTSTDLFGYQLSAEASPLSVLFFEDLIPIPTDPGEPQFEISTSYTLATLSSGPVARAIASSVWPGAAVGDGFGTVIGDESQTYPMRASAIYPGQGADSWDQTTDLESMMSQQSDGNFPDPTAEEVEEFRMTASARGLDVRATADGLALPVALHELVDVGSISSVSTSTVEDGVAVARSVSQISEISIAGGTLVLDGIESVVESTADGATEATSGTTSVGAIEVLGVARAALTDRGVVITAEDQEDGPAGRPGDLLDPVNVVAQRILSDLIADGLEETLGISVAALDQTETLTEGVAQRTAKGLSITIETEVLHAYLQPLLGVLPIGDLIDLIPDDENTGQLKGLLFELQAFAPKVQILFGRGAVKAGATGALDLGGPPGLPPVPPAPPLGGSLPPFTDGGTVAPLPTDPGAPPDVAPGPDVAPPVAAGTELPEDWGGIPAVVIALLFLIGAVPTYGLARLRDAAVGATASSGPTGPLPNLRGWGGR